MIEILLTRGLSALGTGRPMEYKFLLWILKSMRTASSHLGKGVASHLLEYILTEARRRKYQSVSLETGSFDAFIPARNLYTKFGFTYCEPFSDYIENPNTVFMTIEL